VTWKKETENRKINRRPEIKTENGNSNRSI